jgi:hydrogenase nickel incorporation protein HypB
MCGTCGCGQTEQTHQHQHAEDVQRIAVEQDIMAANDRYAASNRAYFADKHIIAINLMSSPGSGKTSLLVETLTHLQPDYPLAVIEGDQQTDYDAQRIAQTGVSVKQINTGKGCHLDAHQVGHAAHELSCDNGLLFIENVGNLVCPSLFDLGEAQRVVILSVTEGDNKPLKYPHMFQAASLMVINKIDLLPYVEFDVAKCIEYARRVNPAIQTIELSATRQDNIDAWYHWLAAQVSLMRAA